MKILKAIIGIIIIIIAWLLMIIITLNEFENSKPVTFRAACVLTAAIIFYLMREFIMPILYRYKYNKNGLRCLNIPIQTNGFICNNDKSDCDFLERFNDGALCCKLFKTTLDKIGGDGERCDLCKFIENGCL